MPAGMTRWFNRHFLEPQTGRDIDLEHWWQMPEDPTRTESPWRQIVVDLIAPAPFSEWHERVAERRVLYYDRIRPTLVRVGLLIVVVTLTAPLHPPWWYWAMLVPAVLQGVLEIYLYKFVVGSSEPDSGLMRYMAEAARAHFNTKTLNFTGAVGVVACPLIILAVCLTPPEGDVGWVKMGALTAAIFYLNSGLTSVLLDPPNYTESSVMPPVMHAIRPFVPLISLAVVAAMVVVGAARHTWEAPMLPLAFMCSTLTLLVGGTVRSHDRMVAASAQIAREAVLAGRTELGRMVHDDLGPAKAAAESVSSVPGVPYSAVVDLRSLAAFLKHFNTRIGIYASQRMHLSYLVEKLVSPYGISPRQVTFDIAWDEDAIRKEDHRIATRMVTALVHNLAQTLERSENTHSARDFTVVGWQSGCGRNLRYHLAVRDHLPAIPEESWCIAGTSMAVLRDWLRTDFNGELTQEILGDGTKQIIASWDDQSPAEEPDVN